jgi:protein-S-isoprenylcysteine O-methyltransferase Ste14
MGIVVFLYGVICYLVFLDSLLYSIGFVGNLVVPKMIDSGPEGPAARALLVNSLLLGLFAVQHSVMARQGFKSWWTKIVPESTERSTYVLISSLLLLFLYWKWQPMTGVVWTVEVSVGRLILHGLFWLGWGLVFLSSFLIDHFDLFGLRQVYLRLRGREYTPVPFKKPSLYKFVRHPLLLGFLIAFWATPDMTAGHLLFAAATTAYTFVGILLEERDSVRLLGAPYEQYRNEVPMMLPGSRRRSK